MILIGNVVRAKEAVLSDIRSLCDRFNEVSRRTVESAYDGIQLLRAIRSAVYEDLNQLPHEYLLLAGIRWLTARGFATDAEWSWDPRQTGDSSEPDIRAIERGVVTISAEATTSEKPCWHHRRSYEDDTLETEWDGR